MCGEAFARSDHLTTHKKIHLEKEDREYPCRFYKSNGVDECNYRGATKSDINRHHKTHEKAGDKELPENHVNRNKNGPKLSKTRGANKDNQVMLSESSGSNSESGKISPKSVISGKISPKSVISGKISPKSDDMILSPKPEKQQVKNSSKNIIENISNIPNNVTNQLMSTDLSQHLANLTNQENNANQQQPVNLANVLKTIQNLTKNGKNFH